MNEEQNVRDVLPPPKSGVRQTLDHLFKRWYIELPVFLCCALALCLLNCFLSQRDDRAAMTTATPIVCVVTFAAVFLLLTLFDRLPFFPQKRLDNGILLLGTMFLLIAIFMSIIFFLNVRQNYIPAAPALLSALGAMALFSRTRKKPS